MKLAQATLTCCILAIVATAHADIRIGRDTGGIVRDYEARVQGLRFSGQRVVIDGVCSSACTLHLNLPRDQICATPRAIFVFHTVSDKMLGLPNWHGNEQMMNAYPPHVRMVVMQRGGLWLKPFSIRGTALVPACR